MNRPLLTLLAALAGFTPATAGTANADGVFANATPLPVGPVPTSSAIDVAGQSGRVTQVTVSLYGVSHEDTRDLDVLLVSPDGRHTLVVSEACSGRTIGRTWTFDDDAPGPLGLLKDGCAGLRYRPTDHNTYRSTDFFPGAPPAPYSAFLSNLIGAEPNGSWRLHVSDELGGAKDGLIASGWSMELQTAPAAASVPGAASGAASQYPLTTEIAGLDGVIEDLDVTVPQVRHGDAGQLVLMLVGPGGQRLLLKGGECGGAAARGETWTFNDEAPGPLPAAGSCPSGSYRVSDTASSALPAPAPDAGGDHALSVFDGADPNGAWRLYAADVEPLKQSGLLGGPVELKIKRRPAAAAHLAPTALTLAEGASDRVVVTREASASGLGAGAVTLATVGESATAGEDFTPSATTLEFAAGQTTRSVSIAALADAQAEPDETFRVVLSGATGDAAVDGKQEATVTITGQAAAQPGPGPSPGGEVPSAPGPFGGEQPQLPLLNGSGDLTPPAISGVRLSHGRVVAGRSARSTLRFYLSEPAAVTVAVLGARGRTVATVTAAGLAGANRLTLRPRARGAALRPGRYRVVVRAADAAGNRSSARPLDLRIVRSAHVR